MGATAKDVVLMPVTRRESECCVRSWHYSARPYNKSIVHIGAFLNGYLCGVMAWGPGIDTRKLIGVIPGTPWDGYIELNRMAFSPALPRNSESRALAICIRAMRQHAPWLHWLVSFSDGAQSGSGVIYRASGWTLTQDRKNVTLYRAPNGKIVSQVGLHTSATLRKMLGARSMSASGCERLQGRMRRYMIGLTPDARHKIDKMRIDYAGTLLESSETPSLRAFDSTCPLHVETQLGDRPSLAEYIAAMPRYIDPQGQTGRTMQRARRRHAAYADLWEQF